MIDAHAKYKPSSFFNAPTAAEFQYALLLDYTTLKRVAQNFTLQFLIMKMFSEK